MMASPPAKYPCTPASACGQNSPVAFSYREARGNIWMVPGLKSKKPERLKSEEPERLKAAEAVAVEASGAV